MPDTNGLKTQADLNLDRVWEVVAKMRAIAHPLINGELHWIARQRTGGWGISMQHDFAYIEDSDLWSKSIDDLAGDCCRQLLKFEVGSPEFLKAEKEYYTDLLNTHLQMKDEIDAKISALQYHVKTVSEKLNALDLPADAGEDTEVQ